MAESRGCTDTDTVFLIQSLVLDFLEVLAAVFYFFYFFLGFFEFLLFSAFIIFLVFSCMLLVFRLFRVFFSYFSLFFYLFFVLRFSFRGPSAVRPTESVPLKLVFVILRCYCLLPSYIPREAKLPYTIRLIHRFSWAVCFMCSL